MRADLHELASFNDVNDEYSSAAAARAATKPRGPSWLPHLGLVLVQVSYCVWHVLGKSALNGGMSPYVLALYRQVGASFCMVVLAKWIDSPRSSLLARLRASVSRRDARRLVLLGLLGFGNIYGFIVALSYVTAFNSALLHPVIPVFAAGIAIATRVEGVSLRKLAGVCVSAGGALVVVVWGVREDHGGERNTGATSHGVIVGNCVLVGQCVCMSALLVLQKIIMNSTGLPSTTVTAVYNLIAAAIALIATPLLVGADFSRYAFSSLIEVLATLYGALVGICFVYCVIGWATQRTSPTLVSLSMTLQPPFNAVLSVLFMGRRSFSPGEIGGGVLITAGLCFTVLAPAAPAPANDRAETADDLLDGVDEVHDELAYRASLGREFPDDSNDSLARGSRLNAQMV